MPLWHCYRLFQEHGTAVCCQFKLLMRTGPAKVAGDLVLKGLVVRSGRLFCCATVGGVGDRVAQFHV